MFQQNEKTKNMFLTKEEEASCILEDIFGEDKEKKSLAINNLYASYNFSTQEELYDYCIENEDDLYDNYFIKVNKNE